MLVQQFLDGILLSPAPTNQLHDPLRPEFLGGAVGVNRRSLFVPSTFDHHGPNLAILVHRARGLQVGDRFGFPDLVSHLRHPVELLLRQIVHPFIGIFGPTDEQRPPLARSLILAIQVAVQLRFSPRDRTPRSIGPVAADSLRLAPRFVWPSRSAPVSFAADPPTKSGSGTARGRSARPPPENCSCLSSAFGARRASPY